MSRPSIRRRQTAEDPSAIVCMTGANGTHDAQAKREKAVEAADEELDETTEAGLKVEEDRENKIEQSANLDLTVDRNADGCERLEQGCQFGSELS